jgi:FKBP-type peptidyl-prolyl cis-trans isomerase SlyD
MKAQKNKVVTFHYTLKDVSGEEIESSVEAEPMTYLHGGNNIIIGLEKAMQDRQSGDKFEVTIAPEEAYGARQEANVQRIPLKKLKGIGKIMPGQVLNLQTKDGPVQVTVLKMGRFNVDVDANHPLAGETLTFDIEITEVRDASKEEIEHGHVHGPGGHEHA